MNDNELHVFKIGDVFEASGAGDYDGLWIVTKVPLDRLSEGTTVIRYKWYLRWWVLIKQLLKKLFVPEDKP